MQNVHKNDLELFITQHHGLFVSEKLADHMKNHEIDDFWKDIRKHNQSKSALSNCIDGVLFFFFGGGGEVHGKSC